MAPKLWKTNPTALSAHTLPKGTTVDRRISVPSPTQASVDLCETVPSHPGWKEPSDPVAIRFPVAVMATVGLWFRPPPPTTSPIWGPGLFYRWCPVRGISSDPAFRDLPLGPHLCSLQLPHGPFSPLTNRLLNWKPLRCISDTSVHPGPRTALDS